jgi:hypothetical protein
MFSSAEVQARKKADFMNKFFVEFGFAMCAVLGLQGLIAFFSRSTWKTGQAFENIFDAIIVVSSAWGYINGFTMHDTGQAKANAWLFGYFAIYFCATKHRSDAKTSSLRRELFGARRWLVGFLFLGLCYDSAAIACGHNTFLFACGMVCTIAGTAYTLNAYRKHRKVEPTNEA